MINKNLKCKINNAQENLGNWVFVTDLFNMTSKSVRSDK